MELYPDKPLSSVFLKDQEEHSTQADWELVVFATVPPRGFGCRFRLGTALISDAWRASAEVNGEKLAEVNDG